MNLALLLIVLGIVTAYFVSVFLGALIVLGGLILIARERGSRL